MPASAGGSGYAVSRVVVAGAADSVAADPATGTIYVGTSGPNGVAVLDGATGKITATVSLPYNTDAIAVDSASDTVYAFSLGGVAVINGATNTVTTTISLPLSDRSISVAVNPLTHMVYVVDYGHSSVVVIDGSTDAITATIPLAGDPGIRCAVADTANNDVYVSEGGADKVAVIDGSTNTVTDTIALPANSEPAELAADPGDGLLYVADQDSGDVSVINTAAGTVSATITGVPGAFGLALDTGSGTLYATDRAGSVPGGDVNVGTTYVVDTASKAVTAQIPRGGTSAAVLGDTAYVANGTIASPVVGSVDTISPSTTSTLSPVIGNIMIYRYTLGQAGQEQLVASANPAATFSATGLPAGLTLSPAGLLSGTPASGTAGSYQVQVTAGNGVAPADTETMYLTVGQPPEISSANHATFRTGVAGTFTATSTGYPAATFTETGALPSGVDFEASGYLPSAVLSGTPASGTGGRYRITLTANNGVGTAATQSFTLTVDEPAAIVSPGRAVFRTGTKETFTVRARGFPAARLTESGKLPAGLAFRLRANGTAVLTGRASRSDRGKTYKIRIIARNGVGQAARQTLTIRVR
jgi:large repetitive protein